MNKGQMRCNLRCHSCFRYCFHRLYLYFFRFLFALRRLFYLHLFSFVSVCARFLFNFCAVPFCVHVLKWGKSSKLPPLNGLRQPKHKYPLIMCNYVIKEVINVFVSMNGFSVYSLCVFYCRSDRFLLNIPHRILAPHYNCEFFCLAVSMFKAHDD